MTNALFKRLCLQTHKLQYFVDILVKSIHIARNEPNRIVDLMCNPGCQLSKRRHLLLLQYPRLNGLEFSDVFCKPSEAIDLPTRILYLKPTIMYPSNRAIRPYYSILGG